MEIPGRSFPGARDARAFERQAEVRTFTTPPLEASVEWTGRVQAELFVSSTARDTDFIVRISDVYPDGRSILIVDYQLEHFSTRFVSMHIVNDPPLNMTLNVEGGTSITMDVGVGSTATLPIVPEPGAVASIGPFLAALHLLGRRRPPFR